MAESTESPRRGNRGAIVAATAFALAALAGGVYWFITRNLVSTDDAFIEANVTQISPRVSGPIDEVDVSDNQTVQKGDVLFRIDPQRFHTAVDQAGAAVDNARGTLQEAKANLAMTRSQVEAAITEARSGLEVAKSSLERARSEYQAAQAQADLDTSDAHRLEKLFQRHSASRQELDRARAAAKASAAKAQAAQRGITVAKASVAQARAKVGSAEARRKEIAVREAAVDSARSGLDEARARLNQARLELQWTTVRAPATGRITNRSAEVGDMVQPGTALTALVHGKPWVKANFKETQLTRMRPGQSVDVEVDAYPDTTLHGHIDSIQSGTGSRFSLLPPENATGNYVKVVQRVPVKVVLDDVPDDLGVLAPGMSAVPTVDVSSHGTARKSLAVNGTRNGPQGHDR
ncbi:MAG TPA: HlyD family secretion protein [Gammaproteobacteria bacterium]|nr:HlyD family secretion protein [Gammaproteobacteria bacterium]